MQQVAIHYIDLRRLFIKQSIIFRTNLSELFSYQIVILYLTSTGDQPQISQIPPNYTVTKTHIPCL